jgi:hypothetical protein
VTIILQAPDPTGSYLAYDTTSLREIEQEVARRVGPFRILEVTNAQPGDQESATSTTTSIAVKAMRSTIDLGGYEDMFVLRRGRFVDGTRLPLDGQPFVQEDRVRMVRAYRPDEGVLEVDSPYDYAPYDAEEIELHHLEPEFELRPAVLSGLRRCYVVDRQFVPVSSGNIYQIIDLTVTYPWLTSRDQVYSIALTSGAPSVGWQILPYAGGMSMRPGEWTPTDLAVVNRRPAATMVWNGGPGPVIRAGNVNEDWDDEDRFPVPMDYGAAAGHIECWRTVRPRMSLVAQTGMWPEQKEVAAEFTRVSTVFFDPPRHDTALPFSSHRVMDSSTTNVG